MEFQKDENKIGEIQFRKKLFNEQVLGINEFNGSLEYNSIEDILLKRMEKTYSDFKVITNSMISNPFLELGAERCQRALVLENDFNLGGIALDLSFDMLNSASFYSTKFNKPNLPIRICADAYNIPIKSDSLPFVFAYEMLHHFPNLSPIIKEAHRVLMPGGTFYFDEEPFNKTLHFPLIKRSKLSPLQSQNKNIQRIFNMISHFFGYDDLIEDQFNVIENHNLKLFEWKEALSIFERIDAELCSKRFKSDFKNKFSLKYFICYLLGGIIKGSCIKAGVLNNPKKNNLDILICPNCLREQIENQIEPTKGIFICTLCNSKYPIKNGIAILLADKSFKSFYPDLYLEK